MPFRFPNLKTYMERMASAMFLNFTKLQHKKDNIKYFQTFYSFIR